MVSKISLNISFYFYLTSTSQDEFNHPFNYNKTEIVLRLMNFVGHGVVANT